MAIAGDYDESDEHSRLLQTHPPHDGASRSSIIEHPDIYKSRWRSIRVMYLTMFLSSVSFSICMSSVWPYLRLLDPTATADFLGWVVASYSLGQLLASPFFGAWANRRGKSREPLVVSLIINVMANILYVYLESIPNHKDTWLVVARAFIGFGAGNVAVVRSYVSGATTLKERTPTMANISAFQAIGFIIGPAIQTAMVPIGYPGPVHSPGLHIDLYTSPAILSAVCGIINLVLLFVVFREHRVENDEDMNFSIQGTASDIPDYKVDIVAVSASILIFFIVLFLFSVFETIGTPLTMHMYDWTKSEATLYVGIILAVGGVVSIVVFIIIKILSKRVNERYLLLSGFIFCFIGFFVYLPWGHTYPSLMDTDIQKASTPPMNTTPMIENITTIQWTTSISSMYTEQSTQHENVTLLPTTVNTMTTENIIPLQNATVVPTTENTVVTSAVTEASTVTEIRIENATMLPTTEKHITDIKILNATEIYTSEITTHESTEHTTETQPATTAEQSTTEHRTVEQSTMEHTTMEQSRTDHTTAEQSTSIEHTPGTQPGNVEHTTVRLPDSTEHIATEHSERLKHKLVRRNSDSHHLDHESTNNFENSSSSLGPIETTTDLGNLTTTTVQNTTRPSVTVEPVGCPDNYEWCRYTPVITLAQFLIGTLLICIGYPTCNVMSYAIYSKLLGPKPQGVWMGLLTASGSLARTLGPIFVSQIYNSYGPRVTFVSVSALVLLTIGLLLLVFRKLVPFSFSTEIDDPASKKYIED